MKQNNEHQDEGRKNFLGGLSVVSRQSYGSFAFKYYISGCSLPCTQTSPVLVRV